MVSAEQDRKVENAKSARKQNGAGQHLDQKLEVRPHRMQVVVQAQQKNQRAGNENGKNRLERKPEAKARNPPTDQPGNSNAEEERQENSYTTQTGKRPLVQVPLQAWPRYPAMSGSEIAYVPGQDKRSQHRGRKDSQVEKRQPIPLGPTVCNLENKCSVSAMFASIPQKRTHTANITCRRNKLSVFCGYLFAL